MCIAQAARETGIVQTKVKTVILKMTKMSEMVHFGTCVACSTYDSESKSGTDCIDSKNMAEHKERAEVVKFLDYDDSVVCTNCTQSLVKYICTNYTTYTHCSNSGVERSQSTESKTVQAITATFSSCSKLITGAKMMA